MTYQPINNELDNFKQKYMFIITLSLLGTFFTGYFVCNSINNISINNTTIV